MLTTGPQLPPLCLNYPFCTYSPRFVIASALGLRPRDKHSEVRNNRKDTDTNITYLETIKKSYHMRVKIMDLLICCICHWMFVLYFWATEIRSLKYHPHSFHLVFLHLAIPGLSFVDYRVKGVSNLNRRSRRRLC